MGKRKRSKEKLEPSGDSRPLKRSKRSYKDSSILSIARNAKHRSVSHGTLPQPNQNPQHAKLPQNPEALEVRLSKRQRRRLRRLEQCQEGIADDARTPPSALKAAPPPIPWAQMSDPGALQKRTCGLIAQVTRTVLVQPPDKRWIEQHPPNATEDSSEASTGSALVQVTSKGSIESDGSDEDASQSTPDWLPAQLPRGSIPLQLPKDIRISEQAPADSLGDEHDSDDLRQDSSDVPRLLTSAQSDHGSPNGRPPNPSLQVASRLRAPTSFQQPPKPGQSFLQPQLANVSTRHSALDFEEAFQRFDRFLGGRDTASSDSEESAESDESDESEGSEESHASEQGDIDEDDEKDSRDSQPEEKGSFDETGASLSLAYGISVESPIIGKPQIHAVDSACQLSEAANSETQSVNDRNEKQIKRDNESEESSRLKPDNADNEGTFDSVAEPVTREDASPQNATPTRERSTSVSTPPSANVGLERQDPFLGGEPGGDRSGSGEPTREESNAADPEGDLHFNAGEFSNEELPYQEDDKLFRAVDEVSNDVFGLTRAIPWSQRTPTRHPQEERAIPQTPSDSGLKISTPPSSPPPWRQSFDGRPTRLRSPIVLIRASEMVDEPLPTTGAENVLEELELPAIGTPKHHDLVDIVQSKSAGPPSERSRTPIPSSGLLRSPQLKVEESSEDETFEDAQEGIEDEVLSVKGAGKKRKMTGITSTHFSARKTVTKGQKTVAATLITSLKGDNAAKVSCEQPNDKNPRNDSPSTEFFTPDSGTPTANANTEPIKPTKRKSTGKVSEHFPVSPSTSKSRRSVRKSNDEVKSTPKKGRVPKGTSICPFPPVLAQTFGIIQEKLWDQPFWLLVAVTFLNKTTGRAAVPIFWDLKELYSTPEALAKAKEEHLEMLIHCLGFQKQRSKRLIQIAKAWIAQPPVAGRLWRTLHYPIKEDGKKYKERQPIDEDPVECAGALEIGHFPGCGPYAWDSWRIFCRDVQRGVAADYNGTNAASADFVPEWQRVLPLDKELRACLRWMWLREGWIWNHETGERRRVNAEEWKKAVRGEMEPEDEQEGKFVAQAVGRTSLIDPGLAVGDDDDLARSAAKRTGKKLE